ncbi:hypothetical protein P9272_34710 [Mesorhizobium sp. WSM4976]|uniref:hypothetical protein n=1 Tax=Mesorhizobium sp. WSM4976 TaxID=3038549 RepID=UPI002417644F|nr:hypothetical protein [Mesorhizobium sp. WSM4976]MDG4898666.1 hypothetical protein [Mesorhizobium sp. WSM4976]
MANARPPQQGHAGRKSSGSPCVFSSGSPPQDELGCAMLAAPGVTRSNPALAGAKDEAFMPEPGTARKCLGPAGVLSRGLDELIDLLSEGKPLQLPDIVPFAFQLCPHLAEIGIGPRLGEIKCPFKGRFPMIHGT